MFRIALRNLWEHKLRTVLLGLAVVAGVGFVTAAYVFTDSLSAAFDQAFAAGAGGIDIQVQPVSEDGEAGGGPGAFDRMPVDVVEGVAAVEGVESATPTLQGLVTVVVEGEEQQLFGPPDFGINWTDTGPYEILTGGPPESDDEVMVDTGAAESRGIGVGDTVEVAGAGRARTFEVVGTFGLEGGTAFGGATFLAFTFDTLAELLEVPGQVNAVEVVLAEGASPADVISALGAALPDDVEALDARAAAAEQADELQEGISFFNTFLLVFGAIALVVGAFVVYNAFRVVVAQRSRELALLRILGTTRAQLVRSVLGEALVVGAIASVIGLGAGLGLAVGIRALLAATGGDLPDSGLVLSPRTVVVGLVVGILTTLLSAVVPAARTTRISPMEALRDQPELRRVKPWWAWVGGVVLAGAVALVLVGVVSASDAAAISGDTGPLVLIGLGCVAAFGGVFLLARAVSRPVIGALGAPARSIATTLGRENARRTPRRTAVTASALMIGLGLVATVAVLARSVEDTILGALEEAFASDLVVSPAGVDPFSGMSTEVGDVVAGVEGVDEVARLNVIPGDLPTGGTTFLAGVDPATVEVAVSFEDVEGSMAHLGPGTVAIQRIEAERQRYAVGDVVDLTIEEEPYPAEVVAIFDLAGGVSDTQSYYLSYDEVASFQASPRDFSLSVAVGADRDPEQVAGAVEDALAEFPSVQVTSVSDLVGQIQSALNAVVGMVAGLLFMSVAVAVVGIVLTLYLAVYERTRETGMLRAVGMTRRQVRRMIRFESVLIAVFGTLLGLVLGLFCGWALSVGVVGEGVRFGVPWVWIGSGLVGALVAGVVAAVIPARRASRLDVLEAIAYE
jgi:putative ABC transport system permease protein